MKKKGTRCLHQDTKPLITPSLHLCFFQDIFIEAIGCQDVVLFALPNAFITTNKQHVKAKKRCRDGVMSGFVSWCRHLVPFFFMK